VHDTAFPVDWAIDGMNQLVDGGHPFFWHLVDGGHGAGLNPAAALQRYQDLKSSTGPGTSAGATWPEAGGGAPCNDVKNAGTAVPEQAVASDSPTPAGGAIADGTYALTGLNWYTGPLGAVGPTGRSVQWTVVIAGQRFEEVILDSTTDAGSVVLNGGFVAEGSKITIVESCPWVAPTGFWAFDSNGTIVTLYSSETPLANVSAATFTKQ
jgi:hypothetical protein